MHVSAASLVASVLLFTSTVFASPIVSTTSVAPHIETRTFGLVGGILCSLQGKWLGPRGGCYSYASRPQGSCSPGKTCPRDWNWVASANTCVPSNSGCSKKYACPAALPFSGFSDYTCSGTSIGIYKPSASLCSPLDFFWPVRSLCCALGAVGSLSCPQYRSCPSGWSWGGSYCIPSAPSHLPNPSCSTKGHSWYSASSCCSPPVHNAPGPSSCASSHFWWGTGSSGSCCSNDGHGSSPSQPPPGKSCPSSGWYWSSKTSCCIPKTASDCAPKTPTCSTAGHVWDADTKCCKPPTLPPAPPSPPKDGHGCKSDSEFWWSGKKQCCTKGGSPSPSPPPAHMSCPSSWNWHSSGYCVPSRAAHGADKSPSCSKAGHSWLSDLFFCAGPSYPVPSVGVCSSISFLWSPLGASSSFCVVLGGVKSAPSPPSGKSCPSSSWWWDNDNGCCTPSKPSDCTAPIPSCGSGWAWHPTSKCCLPVPASTTSIATTSVRTTSIATTSSTAPKTNPPSSTKPTPTSSTKGCDCDDDKPTTPPVPSSTKVSTCPGGQFFWKGKKQCCKDGGNPSPPSPPSHMSCPSGWSWHSSGYCVPSTPAHGGDNSPKCSKTGHSWFPDLFCCGAPNFPHANLGFCALTQFSWFPVSASSSFCLSLGHSTPKSPPSGKSCPTNGYYWDDDNSCCTPSRPPPSEPQCGSGWKWNASDLCCKKSSGSFGR